MKLSMTKSMMAVIATAFATTAVMAPYNAHASDDALAQMSIAQIGEINRRAQLLKQSEVLGQRMAEFQKQYDVTISSMKPLREELKAAQVECEETCTSQQTQSLVQSIKKFSAVAGGTVASIKGLQVAAGGMMRLSKTELAPKGKALMNANLQSFYRPWKTIAGRTMMAAGAAYMASTIVDNIIFTNNRASQEDIKRIQTDLDQREITLQKVQENIAELNKQLRPITLALQQSQMLQSYANQK